MDKPEQTLKKIVVHEYNPQWPPLFQQFKEAYKSALGELAVEISHVGSTSVPGLAAKPVLDINIGINREEHFEEVKARLADLGYTHRGDLDIPGRESFKPADDSTLGKLYKHHLYVSDINAPEYIRHIAFRDYLRTHPEEAQQYGKLKQEIVQQNPDLNIDEYIERKYDLIAGLLKKALESIDRMDLYNRDANYHTEENFTQMLKQLGLLHRKQEILNLEFTSFDDEGNLKHLDLGLMGLKQLPEGIFDKFPTIEMLNLSGNKLTTLPKGVFKHLTNLWAIGLNNNDLTELTDDLLVNQHKLTTFTAPGNKLTQLPSWVSELQERGVKLNFEGNPISSSSK